MWCSGDGRACCPVCGVVIALRGYRVAAEPAAASLDRACPLVRSAGAAAFAIAGAAMSRPVSALHSTGGWSEEAVTWLRAGVAEGLSASRIGEALGVSRCAVIGKCRRMGLQLRGGGGVVLPPAPAESAPVKPAPVTPMSQRDSHNCHAPIPAVNETRRGWPKPAGPSATARPVAGQCLMPLWGDNLRRGLFCGAAVDRPGTSWCTGCRSLVFDRRPKAGRGSSGQPSSSKQPAAVR